MNDDQKILRLNMELDRLLGISPMAPAATPQEHLGDSQDALDAAAWLIATDFLSELHPQPGMQARWVARCHQLEKKSSRPASLLRTRWAWVLLAAVLVLLPLFIFHQPALAAVGRLLGYGYFPQAGFIPLEGTRVLRSPVRQEHAGRSLTVAFGIAMPAKTILWLEESEPARSADGAWLETPTNHRMDLISWGVDPDRPKSNGVRLEFPPLPAGINHVIIALPDGWRIPLEWISASQAGVPSSDLSASDPTAVVASPQMNTLEPTAGPENPPQASLAGESPCIQVRGIQACLAAAQMDEGATRVLLEVTSSDPQLVPGGDSHAFILPNPITGDQVISLTDDLGNVTQLEGPLDPVQLEGDYLLRPLAFPPLASQSKHLTLHIPAFEGSVTFPEPLEVSVDLGADPQPGQSLAVDQTVTVLGQTLRFRQATLSGDGTSSIRVTLTSDQEDDQEGLLVQGLALGKPEGIDDGFGSGGGGPQGVVKLFTELVGPVSGKKTGRLTFPVLGARVLLLGPFELTFPAPAPNPPSPAATPLVIGGDTFTPQPSPTPQLLDNYHFYGKVIQVGDLLFTVVGETTTDLYAINPQSDAAPERVATLPGQVNQVFLHPDRLGIDYLSGVKVNDSPPSSLTFYRSAHVYTLRFADPQPRLLAAFPPGPENSQGTELTANWSYDGRFMIFQRSHFEPNEGKIGWIDLTCRQTGDCQPHYLEIPPGLDLNRPLFSPNSYQVLIAGMEGVRLPDVYLFGFDANGDPGELSNLTNSDQISELFPNWLPDGSGFFTACWDPSIPMNEYDLCQHSIAPGSAQHLLRLPGNMHDITLSPDGKLLADYSYIDNQEQIRVFERETGKTILISGEGDWPFFGYAFSEDGNFLALLRADRYENEQNRDTVIQRSSRVSLYSFSDSKEIVLFDSRGSGTVSWLDWVR